jgi:uncharacterized protein DUF5659
MGHEDATAVAMPPDPTEGAAMKTIRTDDLALATVLRTRGFEPDGLELADGEKAMWVFSGDGDLHATIREYRAGDCRVEPQKYNIKLRETRRMLFQFLQRNGIKPTPGPRA